MAAASEITRLSPAAGALAHQNRERRSRRERVTQREAGMLSNLPIGVYTAGTSPIHRLRARTKLLVVAWLAIAFFVANHKMFHYGTYAVAFLLLAAALYLARVDVGYIWRRM